MILRPMPFRCQGDLQIFEMASNKKGHLKMPFFSYIRNRLKV
jgi:hypothetical protein